MTSETRAAENLRYYATDKEIFDLLLSAKQRLSASALLGLARARGIFYSSNESRDALASSISLLPHDYSSLSQLLGQSENPNRAEKVTSITLNTKIELETIKAVATAFRDSAPLGEKVITHSESPNNYVMQVKYTELDYAKTRLLQRRNREADIRFIIEDDKTVIRMPANQKARDIADVLKNSLDAAAKTEIPAEEIELSDLDTDSRTLFFTRLISSMPGYGLKDVMNIKVQSGRRPISTGSDVDVDEEESDEEAALRERMLAVVENVALHGTALLASSEYQSLKRKGFYITSITWRSQQSSSPFNILEFDAGFEEPEQGTGFRYNVRGFYRNRNGEFTKTMLPLKPTHKETVFPVIEGTARKVLAALRQQSESVNAMSTNGSKQ